MLVETFEVEEVKGEMGAMAADSESIDLIEKLGLTGQKGLSDTKTVTRFPYRKITEIEQFVYKIHCPQETKVEYYNSGLIPLRVLQTLAHAKELNFCDKGFFIWHPEDVRLNPVLIGKQKHNQYEWSESPSFILARWGNELKPFEVLKAEAAKIWGATARVKLNEIKAKVDSMHATFDYVIEQVAATGKPIELKFE